MKNWGHSLALLGTWMLIPLGCSTGDKVDLGATKGSALVDYAASWDGYAEAYKFDKTTSDRIRITLDANGEGTLEVGEQPLFPPATDFDVGYPIGEGSIVDPGHEARFRPGFRYPLHGTRIETGRLRLYVDPSDPFATWCEHQTSYLDPNSHSSASYDIYRCLPPGGSYNGPVCRIDDGVNPVIPLDCGKLSLCQGFCGCTASGCTAPPPADYRIIQLDAALESAGNSMVGTLVLNEPNGPGRVTVRLTRN